MNIPLSLSLVGLRFRSIVVFISIHFYHCYYSVLIPSVEWACAVPYQGGAPGIPRLDASPASRLGLRQCLHSAHRSQDRYELRLTEASLNSSDFFVSFRTRFLFLQVTASQRCRNCSMPTFHCWRNSRSMASAAIARKRTRLRIWMSKVVSVVKTLTVLRREMEPDVRNRQSILSDPQLV